VAHLIHHWQSGVETIMVTTTATTTDESVAEYQLMTHHRVENEIVNKRRGRKENAGD
jgi:hypothetical protein